MTQALVMIRGIHSTELGPQVIYDVVLPSGARFSADYIIDSAVDATQNDTRMWSKIASDVSDYGGKIDTGTMMLVGAASTKDVTTIPALEKPVETKPNLFARAMDKLTSMWG